MKSLPQGIALCLVAVTLLFAGCNKDDNDDLPFRAVVLNFGSDCSDIQIQFTDNVGTVTQITGALSDTYYAGQLQPALQEPGNRLKINFRLPLETDFTGCTSNAPDFPLIIILGAELDQ